MNKIYSFLSLAFCLSMAVGTSAQTCDTLRNYDPADDLYQISAVPASNGFIWGHNLVNGGTEDVLDWAEPYNVVGPIEVRRITFVPWKVVNGGGSVTFHVYDDNAGEPGTSLASEVVNLADLTQNTLEILDFNTPASVNGNFWVGMEMDYTNAGDSLAILGTNEAGQGPNFTYMNTATFGWEPIDAWYAVGANDKLRWRVDVLVSNDPDPVADFNFNAEACLGGDFNVDGSPSANVAVYDWILGDNPYTTTVDNASGLNATLTPTASGGSQAIYLIADGSCKTDVIGYVVNVYDPVSATITPTNTTCNNNNGQIAVSGQSGGSGTYTYSLDGVTYQGSNTFTGLASGNYTVYVATTGDACETTYNVTVGATPPETITVGTDQTICAGDNATITASGNGTIEWFDGATSLGNGTSMSVSPTSNTTYTATLTDANGCEDTDQVSVTVNPLPTVNAGADTDICNGDNTTITGSGASTYSWDNGLGAGVSHTVSPATTTTYQVTGTDGNGCTNTDQVTITVNPLPIVNAGADTDICPGDNTTITASGASTYSWDNSLGAGASHTVSPGTTTTYEVTGTDGNGCVNTDQVTITVNVLPTVSAGTDTDICIGDNTTITASGASTYSWDNGLGAGVSHTVSPTSNTTYEVTGTDGNGCTNTDQVTITVNPLPTVSAGADTDICLGDNTTITATGASTYTWDNSLGAGVSHTVSPATTTTYQVTGTDGNGCANTDDVTITVNPLPTVNAGADTDICPGDNTTITATGASSYNWDNSLGAGASHTVSPTSTTTYEVTGTDGNGCVNTDQVTVTVNPIDDASFVFNNFCEGSANSATSIATPGGTFAFNPAPGDGATIDASTGEISNGILGTTYSVEYTTNGPCPSSSIETVTVQSTDDPAFSYDDVCIGNNNAPYNIATAGGTFSFNPTPGDGATIDATTGVITGATQGSTYTIEYVTPSGICQASSSQTVDVFVAPTVTASNDETVCDGDPANISGSGADTYTWDNGLGAGASHTVTPGTTTTYEVTGEDANGCTGTDQVTITVNPLPAVDAGADQEICEEEEVTLTASGADTYTWDNGLGAGASHNVIPPTTTTYTVTGEDANGCTNTDNVTVTVNAGIIVSGNVTPTNGGNNGAIDITVSGGDGNFTYNWSNGETTEDISDLAPGTYSVIVTDGNGCETEVTFVVDDVTSVQEEVFMHLEMYPNPTDQNVTIQLNQESFSYQVVNTVGKTVSEGEAGQKAVIYTGDFESGVYFVRILIDNHEKTLRLVVNH